MKLQDVLSSPDKWSQRGPAFTKDGVMVSVDSPDAVSFCLLGALSRKDTYAATHDSVKTLYAIVKQRYNRGVIAFNDDSMTTFEEVLSVAREFDSVMEEKRNGTKDKDGSL